MKSKIIICLLVFILLLTACASTFDNTSHNTEANISTVQHSSDANISFTDSVSNSSPSKNESDYSEPVIENPGIPLDSMLGEYSFVSDNEGTKTILFFESEQIIEFQEKQKRGEKYSVSKEEFDFIIFDTLSAFEEYDIIYIRDIDGILHKYYGLSFYTSQEYYDSFGGFELGTTDATFDYRRDLFEVLFMRLSVLSSSVQEGFEPGGIIFSDTDDLTNQELADLAIAFETVYVYESTSSEYVNILQKYAGAGVIFDIRDCSVIYANDLSAPLNAKPMHILGNENLSSFISPLIGHYKYDTGAGKVVVVELYEEKAQKMIARIRLDETNNPEEIKKIEELARFSDKGSASTGDVITKYRAVIYLNGISILGYPRDSAIKYNPDGDIDRFDVTYGEDVFPRNPLWLKGAKPLTEYINKLLEKELAGQE